MKNPFDAPPIRAAPLPGQPDPTGELGITAPDPLADSETPPPPPAEHIALAVEFRGDAAEYARLWIVNLMLTLVTLGLYSPWAAVAQRRYLASRTCVGDLPLVYHGQPWPILRGRALAAAIGVAGWALTQLVPSAKPVVIAAAILAAPWFLLGTFAFDARNYSWRGIHFSHSGSYRQALKGVLPLLLWPLSIALVLVVPSRDLGTAALLLWMPLLVYAALWPWTVAAITHLRFDGLRYGDAVCTLRATNREFYRLYFRGMGPRFMMLVFLASVAGSIVFAVASVELAAAAKLLLVLLITAVSAGYARGRRFNLALHRLTVGQSLQLRSALVPDVLARMYVVNALWLVATVGLATPWRRIETLKLRCRHVTVYASLALADVKQQGGPPRSAFGQSLAEGLSLDLSL